MENQVQEEEFMSKVYKLIQCCDKFKQIKNAVNVEGTYMQVSENKSAIPLKNKIF